MKEMSSPETRPLIDSIKYTKYTFLTSIDIDNDNNNNKLNDISSELLDDDDNNKNKIYPSIIGIICIIICVLDWVLMSEIIQSSEEHNYNKPFLMRFMVNTTYLLMIIPWICIYLFCYKKRIYININNDDHKLHHILFAMIFINFMSLSSGYIWYLSLSRTVASINNTIFQSNCVFVLIYSYFLLGENINFTKICAAIIAISGVAMISFSTPSSSSDSSDSSSSIIGIILCILSMSLFAFFEVLFKYFGHKYFRFGYELSDTLLFQFGIGLSNLLFFWPIIIILNYSHFEIFEIPNYNQLIHGILMPCFLDLLFTSTLLCGITFCGAIFMSIGLILVIPITFFSDIIILKKISINIINIYSIIGALCIIIGFILIQINHNHQQRETVKTQQHKDC